MWNRDEFAKNIRLCRRRKGITQRMLQESAGVSERTIRSLENGLGIPSVATVYKIAYGLGVRPERILPSMDAQISK